MHAGVGLGLGLRLTCSQLGFFILPSSAENAKMGLVETRLAIIPGAGMI